MVDKLTDRQKERWLIQFYNWLLLLMPTSMDGWTETDRQIDRQKETGRETDKQTGIKKERHRYRLKENDGWFVGWFNFRDGCFYRWLLLLMAGSPMWLLIFMVKVTLMQI